MSGLGDLTQQAGDPLDLFGGQAAARSQRIADASTQASMAESARQFDIGQARLEPFTAESVPAFQMQSAQSGAQGPEAQGLAFQQFADSPATSFLRSEGLRMSSPGVSGERLKALEQFGQGLALQDFGNQFNRLGSVAGSGQAAASNLAQAGEIAGAQNIRQQQEAFGAQQQGLAAQQAARANMANTGIGVGAFFARRRRPGQGGGEQ
jgi:hypothetical protein